MFLIRQVAICSVIGMLSSCSIVNQSSYPMYQPYPADKVEYNNAQYNPSNDSNSIDYEVGLPTTTSEVTVPESYHVGAYHSPVSAKNVDRHWVSSQNPQGYTIEVADDEKASRVAEKLYQLPKNDRMAEIKYHRYGRDHYKGVYGSYSRKEDAEKALNALPDAVKASAGIKNWNDVQRHISE